MKSPYHVGPVFLHKPSRVKSFGYVMLLSLLVYTAFEYILREQMEKETEPLILPGKCKSFRPTGISVLEMFDEMTTILVESDNGRQRMMGRPHDPQIERILGLFGLDLNIYSEVQTAVAERARQRRRDSQTYTALAKISLSFSRKSPAGSLHKAHSAGKCSFQLVTSIHARKMRRKKRDSGEHAVILTTSQVRILIIGE